ncbi:MAG: hypothetical protein R3A45_12505 [Bdellovibrionota bacterium]
MSTIIVLIKKELKQFFISPIACVDDDDLSDLVRLFLLHKYGEV